jgi:imidazolonepropionase-like amidohydrolase
MRVIVTLVSVMIVGSVRALTPVADLAQPPASAQHFTIMSSAGKHGESARWTVDGAHLGRESMILRGQIFELDSTAHFGADGMFDSVAVRGFTPNGDAAETLTIQQTHAAWKSPVDEAAAAYAAPAMYVPFGGPIALFADVVERLVSAPQVSIGFLPGGSGQAQLLTTSIVGEGASKRKVTAYTITGVNNTPVPVWVDAQGKFFASIGMLSWIPTGYEAATALLQKAQDEALAKRSPGLVRTLLHAPEGPVAFVNVRAFLGGTHFAGAQTVVVDKGTIVAAGDAAGTPAPAGALVIDGAGKTLVPGLWDSHMHFSDDSAGPMLLSLGITSARDPGNVNALTLARAARRVQGKLLTPHVYPSVLIDGKGPNSAQVATIANSQSEALAIVRRAKTDGFIGIKLYGTFDSDWVRATAAEAHRLGLHVHGHLPAGMRPSQAINAGYDEITHINFVIMQAMPDDVVGRSNGIARFEGPGRFAKDVDLNADPMKSLIATMASRQITVDPTLVVFENLLVPENGDLSPAYAPFLGTLPPAVERGFRQGGVTVPADLTRDDYRRSFAKLSELVGALHRAGVPIVAGTDGSGLELVRELELYVAAGMTPAEALACATINTAHLVGVDAKTGSIAVGKSADLVLVEGDPSKVIGDLRHTRTVMMEGKLMDADALRNAGGFAGRPQTIE